MGRFHDVVSRTDEIAPRGHALDRYRTCHFGNWNASSFDPFAARGPGRGHFLWCRGGTRLGGERQR